MQAEGAERQRDASYPTDPKQKVFRLTSSGTAASRRAATSLRGFVSLDRATHHVMQVIYDADEIPSDFPILGLHTVVARGFVETGGEKSEFEKQYLLAKSATSTISVVIHQSHPGKLRLEALLLDSGQLQLIELVE